MAHTAHGNDAELPSFHPFAQTCAACPPFSSATRSAVCLHATGKRRCLVIEGALDWRALTCINTTHQYATGDLHNISVQPVSAASIRTASASLMQQSLIRHLPGASQSPPRSPRLTTNKYMLCRELRPPCVAMYIHILRLTGDGTPRAKHRPCRSALPAPPPPPPPWQPRGPACRVFAPSVYIFFASVIPGLAFGEQIESLTKGAFNGVHVLISTAISGSIQSFVGGQPLLILGVAEPIVLMYGFMYQFADGQGFADVFVPWCTWVTIWCSAFLLIFAFTGTPLPPKTIHPCKRPRPT